MNQPTAAVNSASFKNPEEGLIAFTDRLVMAATYNKVSDSALRTLIVLCALATESSKVVALTAPAADLDELARNYFVQPSGATSVVIL